MIDLLEENPVEYTMLATILLAQAGVSTMEKNDCGCCYCPIEIEEFKVDVHRILITANGKQYELFVNADRADRDELRAAYEEIAELWESIKIKRKRIGELERMSRAREANGD